MGNPGANPADNNLFLYKLVVYQKKKKEGHVEKKRKRNPDST